MRRRRQWLQNQGSDIQLTNAKIDIERLIPHAGTMVLIDSVTDWDENGIICRTASHRRPDNPLRNEKGLPATSAIEYGGQAAAVHGGLTGRRGDGLLVAVRDLTAAVEYLDQVADELVIEADCLASSAQSTMYRFRIHPEGASDTELAAGRITIALEGAL
jgi:predicted hotdog family 3-hydroxylacyl-ACP dehydratase